MLLFLLFDSIMPKAQGKFLPQSKKLICTGNKSYSTVLCNMYIEERNEWPDIPGNNNE